MVRETQIFMEIMWFSTYLKLYILTRIWHMKDQFVKWKHFSKPERLSYKLVLQDLKNFFVTLLSIVQVLPIALKVNSPVSNLVIYLIKKLNVEMGLKSDNL